MSRLVWRCPKRPEVSPSVVILRIYVCGICASMSVESRLDFVARNQVLGFIATVVILVNPALAGACISLCDQPMQAVSGIGQSASRHHHASHAPRAMLTSSSCCIPESPGEQLCSRPVSSTSSSFVPATNAGIDAPALSPSFYLPDGVATPLASTSPPGSPPLVTRSISVLRI